MTSKGYTTKFKLSLIEMHSDFTAASWIMNTLSAGTDDIVSQSGVTISSLGSKSYTTVTYTNLTVTYIIDSSASSDVYSQIDDQSYSLVENNVYSKLPDLPGSSSGSTSISYSMSSYNGEAVPSWVLINATTGQLTITAVDISADTTYNFNIDSTISSSVFKKRIILNVSNGVVQYCTKCSDSSKSICSTCNSGYTLNSGSGVVSQSTQTTNSDQKLNSISQALRIACQSLIGVTIILTVIGSLFYISTMTSLWIMTKQTQLYFLLLITGAFIPTAVQKVITGLNFTLNPYQFIPFDILAIYSDFIEMFNFKISNSLFGPVGINSESTIYNTLSFIASLVLIIVFHIFFFILERLSLKCCSNVNSNKGVKVMKYIINRIFAIMTFGVYIRAILEIFEYLLVSSIFEIHIFNSSQTLRKISLIYAFIILILCLILIGISTLLVFSAHIPSEQMHKGNNDIQDKIL